MRLRPYQDEAKEAIYREFGKVNSTLLVLATGMGKTVAFSSLAHECKKRVMIIAHRSELIWQAAEKVAKITGEEPEIEMAEHRASSSLMGSGRVVVSTVQTLNSGKVKRMTKFDPQEFGLVIFDEGHRGVADSYVEVKNHFAQNPECRFLYVTATPDRSDNIGLGHVVESVAYEKGILPGIEEGWLVPIDQKMIHVQGLDYSRCRTTAGDLNGKDLAQVLEFEETLHKIVSPSMEIVGNRKALVFASTVVQAERMTEIFNRHRPACARMVDGTTPEDVRRGHLRDYKFGKFNYLVNVACFVEGFDEPSVEVIIQASPTKSRSRYTQICGRGTRPLDGVVDPHPEAWRRIQAIEQSAKPRVEILDFVGNSGKHKLVTTVDILAGNAPPEVVERARKNMEKSDKSMNTQKALSDAAKQLDEERERARQRDEAKRAALVAKAKFSVSSVSPFDILNVAPPRANVSGGFSPPSSKQIEYLQQAGVDAATLKNISAGDAGRLVQEVTNRRRNGLCSFKQARLLKKNGLDTNMGFREASEAITRLAETQGWAKKA